MFSGSVVEGLRISALPLADAAALICRNSGTSAAQTVFTLNLDHVVKLRTNLAFRQVYGRAGLITADGFPIVLACGLQGHRITRVAGSDLINPICAEAAEAVRSIFLFGSSELVLAQSTDKLRAHHPGLRIAGTLAPPQAFDPMSSDARRCIETIAGSGADICFVALGAPKQEFFADYAKSILPNVSFICIGAGLDFIAGAQARAPAWMQRWGMEWAWRLASDPRRLLWRYVLCLVALPGLLARAARVQRQS